MALDPRAHGYLFLTQLLFLADCDDDDDDDDDDGDL